MLARRGAKTRDQPLDLDIESLVAIRRKLRRIGGDEGKAGERPMQAHVPATAPKRKTAGAETGFRMVRRSEDERVGHEGVRTVRIRQCTYHYNKQKLTIKTR